jgi:leader peptidase (prepilin peptidase)/N-methyltransferase
MPTLRAILAIPVGLLAGGFGTMLADRTLSGTPLGLRSRCAACGASLSFAETLPVLSWFRLGDSCRGCGVSVTVGDPIAEVVTAVLFVWVVLRYDQGDTLVVIPLVLVVAGVALSVTDLTAYRLPDRLVFPTFWLSLVAMAVLSILELERPEALFGAVGSAVGYLLFLFAFHFLKPAAMGFGDVKLALVLGLHTGWVGTAFFDDTRTAFRLTFGGLARWHVRLPCVLARCHHAALLCERGHPSGSARRPRRSHPVAPGGGPVGTWPDRRDMDGGAVSRRRAGRGALAWSA